MTPLLTQEPAGQGRGVPAGILLGAEPHPHPDPAPGSTPRPHAPPGVELRLRSFPQARSSPHPWPRLRLVAPPTVPSPERSPPKAHPPPQGRFALPCPPHYHGWGPRGPRAWPGRAAGELPTATGPRAAGPGGHLRLRLPGPAAGRVRTGRNVACLVAAGVLRPSSPGSIYPGQARPALPGTNRLPQLRILESFHPSRFHPRSLSVLAHAAAWRVSRTPNWDEFSYSLSPPSAPVLPGPVSYSHWGSITSLPPYCPAFFPPWQPLSLIQQRIHRDPLQLWERFGGSCTDLTDAFSQKSYLPVCVQNY